MPKFNLFCGIIKAKKGARMQGENSKSLTIYVNYAGLGDNLFYSHLPRIAKSSNVGGGGL